MESRKIQSSIRLELSIILLMSLIIINVSHGAKPQYSPRTQRQVITDELATGITGTGTSFQSFYGQPNSNPYGQRSVGNYDGMDDGPYQQNYYNNYNGRGYQTGAGRGFEFGGGFNNFDGYQQPGRQGYGNWRGFGMGGYGKEINRNKFGVKY